MSLNTWNKLYISFSNTTLTAYLNENITTIPTNSVIDLTDTTTYFGAVSSSSYTLNGYLCNIKYGNTLPETNVLFDLDYDFKVSSQVDSIGRVKAKTITTSNTQLTSDYSYYKTRVTSQTLPNNQTITYSYDPNTGNIMSISQIIFLIKYKR